MQARPAAPYALVAAGRTRVGSHPPQVGAGPPDVTTSGGTSRAAGVSQPGTTRQARTSYEAAKAAQRHHLEQR